MLRLLLWYPGTHHSKCWWCGQLSGCRTCCSHWTHSAPCSAFAWTCWRPCRTRSCGSAGSPTGPGTSPAPPACPRRAWHWFPPLQHSRFNQCWRLAVNTVLCTLMSFILISSFVWPDLHNDIQQLIFYTSLVFTNTKSNQSDGFMWNHPDLNSNLIILHTQFLQKSFRHHKNVKTSS